MDLAVELAEKFGIESLEMYDALQEVWGNANKADFAARRRNKVVCACNCLHMCMHVCVNKVCVCVYVVCARACLHVCVCV